MKKYTSLLHKRDELVSELNAVLCSVNSRSDRKATHNLRVILTSGKIKSTELREAIGVLKYHNCESSVIERAEELCAQQLLLEEQHFVEMKSQNILNNLDVLRKMPNHDMKLVELERALATVAIAGRDPEEYVSTLRCSPEISHELKNVLSTVMSVRSYYDNIVSCRQLSLDSMLA